MKNKINNQKTSKYQKQIIKLKKQNKLCIDIIRRLSESEEKYKQLLIISPDAITVTDLKGLIVEASQQTANLHGFKSYNDIIGKSGFEFSAPEDHENAKNIYKDILKKGNIKNIECTLLKKDGSSFVSEINATLIRDNKGKPINIITTVRDVTARKLLEELLIRKDAEWCHTFDSISDFVSVHDNSFRILKVNKSLANALGVKPESLVGKLCHEVLHNDKTPSINCPYREMFETKKPVMREKENKYLKKLWMITVSPIFNDNKEIVGAVHIAKDFTEYKQVKDKLKEHRKHLEKLVEERTKELEESEMKYKLITETSIDGIFQLDFSRKLIFCNDAFAVMVGGKKREEIINKHIADYLDPQSFLDLEKINKEVFSGKKLSGDILIKRNDGSSGDFFFSVVPIEIDGKITGMTGFIKDISKYKQIELELKNRASRLESLNKELESFSYSVSHDLRAPLRAIDGFSQALMEDLGDKLGTQGKEYLNRVRSASQTMGELIDDMLRLSWITRNEMSYVTINLSTLVKDILQKIKEAHPEKHFETSISSGIIVYGDLKYITIAMENLLSNAFKFSCKSPNPRIEFGISKYKDKQVFFIRDNGAGFDMTYVDKLFTPFQRLHTKDEFPGIGIGLATVQRIIHLHGGQIWAEGGINRGATFYFTIE